MVGRDYARSKTSYESTGWIVAVFCVLIVAVFGIFMLRDDASSPSITVRETVIDNVPALEVLVTASLHVSDAELDSLVHETMEAWFREHHEYKLGPELTSHFFLGSDGATARYYTLYDR